MYFLYTPVLRACAPCPDGARDGFRSIGEFGGMKLYDDIKKDLPSD